METLVEHARYVPESGMRSFLSRVSLDLFLMGEAVRREWDWRGGSADPYFRLYYVSKGRTELDFPFGSYLLDEGRFHLIPANVPFRYVPRGYLHHLWAHFTAPAMETLPYFQRPRSVAAVDFPEGEGLMRRLYSIVEEAADAKILIEKDRLARRLLEPFFAAMPPEALEFDGGRANAFVQIANYIDANLEKDISMPALAAFLKMRRADFSAEFRRVFGMPPKQYVIMRRLGRARSLLLKDRGMSVKEVAARVGYDNEFFFYRLFKKHLKSTPAEFRRSCS